MRDVIRPDTFTSREREILSEASRVLRGAEVVDDAWQPTREEADLLLTAMAIRSEHTVYEEPA